MSKSKVQKYFDEDDFYVLVPLPEDREISAQREKECCGKHKKCERVSDARRIPTIKGGKK